MLDKLASLFRGPPTTITVYPDGFSGDWVVGWSEQPGGPIERDCETRDEALRFATWKRREIGHAEIVTEDEPPITPEDLL